MLEGEREPEDHVRGGHGGEAEARPAGVLEVRADMGECDERHLGGDGGGANGKFDVWPARAEVVISSRNRRWMESRRDGWRVSALDLAVNWVSASKYTLRIETAWQGK